MAGRNGVLPWAVLDKHGMAVTPADQITCLYQALIHPLMPGKCSTLQCNAVPAAENAGGHGRGRLANAPQHHHQERQGPGQGGQARRLPCSTEAHIRGCLPGCHSRQFRAGSAQVLPPCEDAGLSAHAAPSQAPPPCLKHWCWPEVWERNHSWHAPFAEPASTLHQATDRMT